MSQTKKYEHGGFITPFLFTFELVHNKKFKKRGKLLTFSVP